MEDTNISPDNPFTYHEISVLDSTISYISTGPPPSPALKTVVLLHGNPTSSYLWRNIIPHISPTAHCIAPDLIGMGRSGKPAGLPYRFSDHARYLSAFLSAVLPSGPITFVLHDWGSALGLDWARRHPARVSGLALMEFIRPLTGWHEFPDGPRQTFQAFRTPGLGRRLIVDENAFVEQFLPGCVVRTLGEAEMRHYREPFLEVASREPVWRWPNELPVEGSPADVFEMMQAYHEWLLASEVPKLFFWATPGGLISAEKAAWYASILKTTRSVAIGPGIHYLQEDNPHLIGREVAKWVAEL